MRVMTFPLCRSSAAQLRKPGIPTWVAFRDIEAGSSFDRKIERALRRAKCLIVICSRASVASSYVRAEVQEALRRNKTVMPILIEKCELPLIWKTRQWLTWSKGKTSKFIERLRAALPDTSLAELKIALEEPGGIDRIRAVLQRNVEWLPIEFWMRPEYYVVKDAHVLGPNKVDVFAARMDSVGPRAFMYYFGGHTTPPFSSGGDPSRELESMCFMAARHLRRISKPLHARDPLAPCNLFESEKSDWRELGRVYRQISIYLITGRRSHFVMNGQSKGRVKFIAEKIKIWRVIYGQMTVNLDILTYDRIVANAERRGVIRVPSML